MKLKYEVVPVATNTIKALPDDWTIERYRELLQLTEFEDADLPDGEVEEMTLLALADLDKAEAAELVLTYLLADELNEGQQQNTAHEMEDEKLWEEYADVQLHAAFFSAGSLLYRAFNGGFPKPVAISLQLRVKPAGEAGKRALLEGEAPLLIQLLAPGLKEHSLISRLFADQLAGAAFPEAGGIVWSKSITEADEAGQFDVRLISSEYWLEDFVAQEAYHCEVIVPEEEAEE